MLRTKQTSREHFNILHYYKFFMLRQKISPYLNHSTTLKYKDAVFVLRFLQMNVDKAV